jgi:uncharacterized protein (DUF433 family)
LTVKHRDRGKVQMMMRYEKMIKIQPQNPGGDATVRHTMITNNITN